MVTTISNAKLIENHHAVDGKTLHDELSIKIRKVFATELSDQEIKNAIDICSIGKSYTIEVPISGDIFNEEHLYDINGIIQMSPLFKAVKRITLSKRNDEMYARVWLKGDIRKFLPKGHKYYKS
jgi:hypothetical protein